MKTLTTLLIATAVAAIGSKTFAQTSVTNTFETGDVISASEVNANFNDVLDAIDALSAEVEALQAAAPTNDVTGRTYGLINMDIFFEDQQTGSIVNETVLTNLGGSAADFTFNANGTVSIVDISSEEADLYVDTNGTGAGVSEIRSDSDTDFTADYTQDGGVIEIPDVGFELYASADGSILIYRNIGQDFSGDDNDERFDLEFGVLVELDLGTSPN
jgi:hypothetical protein